MAKNRINKQDLIEQNPFSDLKKSAEEAKASVVLLEKSLEAVKNASKMVQSSTPKSVQNAKDIKDVNEAQRKSNELYKAKLNIDKDLKKERLRLQELNKQQNKLLREEITLEQKQIGTLEKLKIENAQLRREREKLNLETREGTKRMKEINAQLDRNNARIKASGDAMKQQRMNVGNYQSAVQGLRGSLFKLAGAFGVAFGGAQVVSFMRGSIDLFREQEKAVAQVEAGLKSTGNQAGFTAKELQKMASDLQKQTIFGDEEILKDATAQLLTFTNISGEQFDRTQQAALDLATRLDGDLKSASIQLGKALNDPVANLSALSRSGIQFSESQKAVIKDLTESGRLAEAQTLILDELNKQYGGSAKAAAEADGGIQQLKNAIGDAREEFGKYILEALRPTIKSLKEFFENLKPEDIRRFVSMLGTGVTILGKLTAAFIAFKVAVFSLKLAEQIKNFRKFGDSAGTAAENMTKAQSSAKAFGTALKGIGFSVAITLLFELTKGLYDFASGAGRARFQAQLFNEAISKGSERATAGLQKVNNKIDEQINLLRERLSKGEISQLEFEQKSQALTQKGTEIIQKRIDAVYKTREAYAEQIEAQRARVNEMKEESVLNGVLSFDLAKERRKLDELRESYELLNSEVETLKTGKTELKNRTFELELSINSATTATNNQTKAVKEQKEAVDELKLAWDFEQEFKDYVKGYRDMEKTMRELAEDIPDFAIGTEREDPTAENIADPDARFELDRKYIDLATDYFIKRADERIAKIDEEMKAQQDKYDLYAKLASEGNITAKESLAEQERLIAESNLRKEQEEKRKQRILLVSSILNAYNANLQAGDSSSEAFTKAITSSGVLQQFIAALPAFEHGTEDTGLNGGGVDGRGGMLSVLHPNERVMTKEQNLKMKGVSNEKVAEIIHNWKYGKLVDGDQIGGAWESATIVNELMSVKGEISEVKNAIQNKPEHTAEIINATARGFTLVHQTKTPRKTITKRYKA
jgi:hypothetical protein